ncbi:MAG: hypothetical protein A2Y62_05805 [Candidatus Fischerbacteria bacterium RBG_13_37_8]|uniref:Uncharacterized protein n=1 Tax=Candidatus Fischerbacteria bacterium RBG_13_37_8 TaxID=1817863 RepID=A0A1F5VD92_9BACT|nr:MAG: hypothetical protein A2Y62_05805 [Candidatus Fischerbacteria bacterium RBG_13_37_8]
MNVLFIGQPVAKVIPLGAPSFLGSDRNIRHAANDVNDCIMSICYKNSSKNILSLALLIRIFCKSDILFFLLIKAAFQFRRNQKLLLRELQNE